MDDLISRQAAIDALKNDMASLDHIIQGMSGYDVRLDAYVSQRNQVNCDIDTINNLPTVQPEQRWIPVTERLPKDDTVVLVCGKGGGVYTAIHNNSKTWIRGWWKMNSKNHQCNPTAWMPLPEPWEGEVE